MAENIPISSIDDLRTDLDSKVARKHIYADVAAMIIASAQADQKAGELMRVTDASADTNVVTGSAYYDYTGAATESLGDYFLVSAPESAALTDGVGTTANGTAVDIGDLDPSSEMRISNPEVSGVARKGIKWWLDPVNGSTKMQSFEYDGNGDDREAADFSTYIDGNGDVVAEIFAVKVKVSGHNSMLRLHKGFIQIGDLWSGGDTGIFYGMRYWADYSEIDWATDELLIPHQKRIRAMAIEESWGSVNNVVVLNEYYVSKTGLDTNNGSKSIPFLTIQAAIDAAPAGSRSNIYIDEGVYADAVDVNKPVQLIGIKGTGRFDLHTQITGTFTTSVEAVIIAKLSLSTVSISSFPAVFNHCVMTGGNVRGIFNDVLFTGDIAFFTDANNALYNCLIEGIDISRGNLYRCVISGTFNHDGVAAINLYDTVVNGDYNQFGSDLNLYNSRVNGIIGGTAINIINHDKASEILFDDTVSTLGVDNVQAAIDINANVIAGLGGDLLDHASGDGSDHENVTLNDTHRFSDGSGHSKVAANSAKNSYPPADAAKLLTIEENAKDHIPPVHVADYADMADMISKQSEQIIGHPYKTLDDENWQYLRVKTGSASNYDGGGDIEVPVAISMSDYKTDIAIEAGAGFWLALWDCTLQDSVIGGLVVEAPVGATAIFDLNKNGTTMMTTDKIQIESGNKHSIDSTTQPALTTTAISKGDIISGDIDVIGDTTKGKGAQITFTVIR